MSILTDRIAVRLAAFYNEHYPGQDYERSEFLGEADVVVAVVREALLPDQAIEAGKPCVCGLDDLLAGLGLARTITPTAVDENSEPVQAHKEKA